MIWKQYLNSFKRANKLNKQRHASVNWVLCVEATEKAAIAALFTKNEKCWNFKKNSKKKPKQVEILMFTFLLLDHDQNELQQPLCLIEKL